MLKHHSSSPIPLLYRHGFSIVEILAAVMIVSILSTITIGWYAGHRDVLVRISHQRNAQEIVNIGVCATVAGCDFLVPGDKTATVQSLIDGTYGTSGIWKGKLFRLTSLDLEQLPDALPFVKLDGKLLLYDYTGSQP